MSLPENLKFDPAEFSGVVRLFPLPNLVLFPHVLQPLHVFEPRYRDLLDDALAEDQLIAMAVLAPGWEQNYEGRPAVRNVACLGRIATHVRLADGRSNILLAGMARVAIGNELPDTTTFRRASATIVEEYYPTKYVADRETLTRRLFTAFRGALPDSPQAQVPLAQLLGKEIDLAALTDIVAYTIDLPLAAKAELLAEPDIYTRAQCLLAYLSARAKNSADTDSFPPKFSEN